MLYTSVPRVRIAGARKGTTAGEYGVPFPRKRPRQGRAEVNDEFSQAILPCTDSSLLSHIVSRGCCVARYAVLMSRRPAIKSTKALDSVLKILLSQRFTLSRSYVRECSISNYLVFNIKVNRLRNFSQISTKIEDDVRTLSLLNKRMIMFMVKIR